MYLRIGIRLVETPCYHRLCEIFNLLMNLEYLKTDRALFCRKSHFCPNLGKMGLNGKILDKFCSLFFPGNNLK